MDKHGLQPAIPSLRGAGRVVGFGATGETRTFVGLNVAAGCRRIDAALVEVLGRGADIRIGNVVHQSVETPGEFVARFQRLRVCRFESPGEAALLSRELAELQATLIAQLTGGQAGKPIAMGVGDPGLWHLREDDASQYVSLCDAACLAERTGQNVVEGFPANDLAAGGQGGPIAALPLWLLLRDTTAPRLLLDLGRTARLTYLPPTRSSNAAANILSFDVGPGTNLLDYLALRFSDGKIEFDPGGRLAVQGRNIDELIDHWLQDPYFQQALPRWSPVGVQPYDELEESVRMAAETGWSVRDLLCTATHFIVRSILRDIEKRIPNASAMKEIVLTGGGALNGLLLSELAKKLPDVTFQPIKSFGIPEGSLDATAFALLAALHVDHTPANVCGVTGAPSARVLGRLTPGSHANWNQLLLAMASPEAANVSYRKAI